MNKIIFISLFMSALIVGQKSFAWLYTVCNDTNDPVSVNMDYHFCYAEAPKIKTLAPKTCAVIDNSKSFFMNCLIDQVKFVKADGSTQLGSAQGQSYLNPTTWGDYTYILSQDSGKYTVKVRSGVEIATGNRVVAVLKNYSGIGWNEWVTVAGIAPFGTLIITGATAVAGPVGGAVTVVGVGSVALGTIAWDAMKTAFNDCFRNGKYIVWLTTQDTNNPADALELLSRQKGCDDRCLPNPEIIDIDPKTVCAYKLTDNLTRTFSYLI